MTDVESAALRSEILALLRPGDYSASLAPNDDYPCGDSFASLLRCVVHLEFSEAESIAHWRSILATLRELEASVGRKLSVYSAIVDHFTAKTSALSNPLLVEALIFRQTEQMAMVDPLTGAFNRRYMDLILKKECTRCERYEKSFSVCILDLDDFKAVNDTKGHLFGDAVLKEFSSLLLSSVREEDVVCRYGGEEFLLVMPETDSAGAYLFATRLRALAKASPFFRETGITFSGGTASYPSSARDIENLIHAADTALYQAKFNGKDRVRSAPEDRRKSNRLDKSVSFRVLDGPAAQSENRTHNISLGGFQFESSEHYRLHSDLRLIFPSGQTSADAEVEGQITWVRRLKGRNVYGVRFMDEQVGLRAELDETQGSVAQTL